MITMGCFRPDFISLARRFFFPIKEQDSLHKSKLGSHESPPPKKFGLKHQIHPKKSLKPLSSFCLFLLLPTMEPISNVTQNIDGNKDSSSNQSSLKCFEIIIYLHSGKQTWLVGKFCFFQKYSWWKKSCTTWDV